MSADDKQRKASPDEGTKPASMTSPRGISRDVLTNMLLYRERAIREPHSPLQFDNPMRVTGVVSWLLLSGLLLGMCTALFWGVFGTVPTRVVGQGMLVPDSSATRALTSLYGGNLATMAVKSGDYVSEGQVIARIEQPELKQRLEGATNVLSLLRRQRDEVASFYDGFLAKVDTASQVRRNNAAVTIALMEGRTESLKRIRDNYQSLQGRGLAAQLQVEEASDRLAAVEIQLQQAVSEREKSYVDDLSTLNLRDAALREYDDRILEAVRQQAEIKASLDLGELIRSPASGRIMTVDVQTNTRLAPGAIIGTLAEGRGDLDAAAFVSPLDGKKIVTGMRVDVVPATVKAEEFGAIVGTVVQVGVAPETRASMMTLLNNETVVAQFSAMGAPFLVKVKLEKDTTTPTGYRWTSGKGPRLNASGELSLGTLVKTGIVVREQAPLTTVIPVLKRWFGLHP